VVSKLIIYYNKIHTVLKMLTNLWSEGQGVRFLPIGGSSFLAHVVTQPL